MDHCECPSRQEFVYTAQFCEENVYLGCQRLTEELGWMHALAVFVTNPSHVTPMLCQRSSKSPEGLVFWDYHVFMVASAREPCHWLVFDWDTTIKPFPCPLEEYVQRTFGFRFKDPGTQALLDSLTFRIVPWCELRDTFRSDRSHMLDEQGHPLAPFPPYPCIGVVSHEDHCATTPCTNLFSTFVDMSLPGSPTSPSEQDCPTVGTVVEGAEELVRHILSSCPAEQHQQPPSPE